MISMSVMVRRLAALLRGGVLCVFALAGTSAYACRVLDPELQGRYEGGCSADGLAEGRGVAVGVATYEGEFRAGRKHGKGIKSWSDGERYEGDFVDDAKQGVGTYVWGRETPWAGERYIGQYRADMRHGHGVYEWTNGDRYEGPWADDRMTGALTPMQAQRVRHLRALKSALEQSVKSAATVCRIEAPGRTSVFLARGVPVGLADEKLTVRISDALASTPKSIVGTTMTEAMEWWRPCY